MKKRYTFLLVIFYSLVFPELSFSQAYQKFLYTQNEWDVYAGVIPVKTASLQPYISGAIFANEDTVVGGNTYKKAFSRTEDGSFGGTKPCLIREDTIARKVYILSADSVNERILYDFNLVTGDSIYLEFRYEFSWALVLKSGWFYVDSVGTINTMSGVRNTWFLTNPLVTTGYPNLPQLQWIEGIGSTISPVYLDEEFENTFFLLNPEAQYFISLTCAFHDSVAVFHDSTWRATFILNTWQLWGDSCIFNLSGSIAEYENVYQSLVIQPNPVKEQTHIKLKHKASGDLNNYFLIVSDISGRRVKNIKLSREKINDGFMFTRNGMEPGSYLLQLYNSNGLFATGKLIIL